LRLKQFLRRRIYFITSIVLVHLLKVLSVVVKEMKGLDRVQMILGRTFIANARAIINVDQGKTIIRSGDDYISYRVSGQYRYLRKRGMPKEEANLKARGSQTQVRHIRQARDVKYALNRRQPISSS